MTDCRPLSLLSTQTIDGIGRAVGVRLDKRRFRENLYVDLHSGESFAEDAFVGRRLRIGPKTDGPHSGTRYPLSHDRH